MKPHRWMPPLIGSLQIDAILPEQAQNSTGEGSGRPQPGLNR